MAVDTAINEIEILVGEDLQNTLTEAITGHKVGILTYMNAGKWHVVRIGLIKCTDHCLVLEVLANDKSKGNYFRVNQPVGMSFQVDFVKYIFETTIQGIDSSVTNGQKGEILVEYPDKVEKIQRRAYQRQPVPEELNINVLFWHRGYLDKACPVPRDHYWQGSLIDLSAGGMRLRIGIDQQDCFTSGQIVGIQFTPMYYQKPIFVEGHIRYISEEPADGSLCLGIEFLGLEASLEGRQILKRLLDTVSEYRKLNENAKG